MIAAVIGGAQCWRDDFAALQALAGGGWDGPILACNDVGTVLPVLDHWCTLHPDKMWRWQEERAQNGHPTEYVTWGTAREHGIDRVFNGLANGSSGLYTTSVALRLGYTVVLCGVPMDARPNAFRDEKGWQGYRGYLRGWNAVADSIRGKVFSMSGWTKNLLGAPPEDLFRRAA